MEFKSLDALNANIGLLLMNFQMIEIHQLAREHIVSAVKSNITRKEEKYHLIVEL